MRVPWSRMMIKPDGGLVSFRSFRPPPPKNVRVLEHRNVHSREKKHGKFWPCWNQQGTFSGGFSRLGSMTRSVFGFKWCSLQWNAWQLEQFWNEEMRKNFSSYGSPKSRAKENTRLNILPWSRSEGQERERETNRQTDRQTNRQTIVILKVSPLRSAGRENWKPLRIGYQLSWLHHASHTLAQFSCATCCDKNDAPSDDVHDNLNELLHWCICIQPKRTKSASAQRQGVFAFSDSCLFGTK